MRNKLTVDWLLEKLTGLIPPPIDVRFALLVSDPTLGMLPGLIGAAVLAANNTSMLPLTSVLDFIHTYRDTHSVTFT